MYFYYLIDSTILLDSAIRLDSNVKYKPMLNGEHCPINMLSIKDALEALEGKWKLLILFSLYDGPKRFKQIAKEVSGITDKTLSKELKSLETNALIKREVFDTFPPTVQYSITEHGLSLNNLVEELHLWGMLHRKKMMG
ncbi:winged helix-turn-helix transcriptional regulator [Emticicia fluvialis]|uniref:winged helix-turn-helix transcriptional regulator n=1 Tax=Emticicia fluvialis TaxID=2974474 RepID=UPI0036F250A1